MQKQQINWCFQKSMNDLWLLVKTASDFENATLISQKLWELVLCYIKATEVMKFVPILVNGFVEGVPLKYFLYEFSWCQWPIEEQASQTASLVVMELFNRLILSLTQRKHRQEWRTLFAEIHGVVCRDIRFIHIQPLLRIDAWQRSIICICVCLCILSSEFLCFV